MLFFHWVKLFIPGLASILVLSSSLISFAQSNKKSIKWFEKALTAYKGTDYMTAEKAVNQAIKFDSLNLEAYLLLADICNELGNRDGEIRALKVIVRQAPVRYPLAYKLLGDALFLDSQYRQALEAYLRYQPHALPSDSARIRKQIESAEYAASALPEASDVQVRTLGEPINTAQHEYWPAVMADDSLLFFTRLLQTPSGQSFERIFSANRTTNGWETPVPLALSDGMIINEGTMCIAGDGKLLFLTICGGPDGFGSCDIYYSVKRDGVWDFPRNAGPMVNSRAWEAQPALSADRRYLYFASSREGGSGGMDLWRCGLNINDDQLIFGKATNLGQQVNTSGNDFSPFIHADGTTLYFASDGYPGFGGNDLFMTRLEQETWTKPLNLGYPINSPKNDDGLVVSPTSSLAVFSSDRDGSVGYSKDLYSFDLPDRLKPGRVGYMKGFVVDARTKRPLATTLLLSESGTTANGQVIPCDTTEGFLLTLKANQTYALNITLRGYVFHSEFIDIQNAVGIGRAKVRNIELQPIDPGESVVLNNIFFDFNDFRLKPESQIELDKVVDFLVDNPSLVIEISGHTDNVGLREYNLELSEKRARSIVDYLSERIDLGRLKSVGYGPDRPVADNTTEEGRRFNRRSEMTILEY